MLRAEREISIINRLRRDQVVRLGELSSALAVSENTIRRDLQRLEELGFLKRTHGGAILTEEAHGTDDVDWLGRQSRLAAEKERIGVASAAYIEDGEAIILDAGTTTMQIAKHIQEKRNLTVVTNAVNIGLELSGIEQITVVLTGGILRAISQSLIGPLVEEFLSGNVHVDRFFMSAGGITAARGISNANTIEVPIKRAMMAAAREVVLVVTHDKIGKTSFTTIAGLDKIHKVITDKQDEPQLRTEISRIRDAGVEVLEA